jgi:hypothetical protein
MSLKINNLYYELPHRLKDPIYINNVLGISVPLNESFNSYSPELTNLIIQEQLILENFMDSLKDWVKDKKETVVSVIKSPADIALLLKNLIENPRVLDSLNSAYRKKIESFSDKFEEKLNSISKSLDKVGDIVKSKAPKTFDTIKKVYLSFSESLKNYVKKFNDFLNKNITEGWLGFLKSIVLSATLSYVNGKIDFYVKKINSYLQAVGDPFNFAKDEVKGGLNKLQKEVEDGLSNNVSSILAGVGSLAKDSFDNIASFFKGIAGKYKWLWTSVVGYLVEISKVVRDSVKTTKGIDLTRYRSLDKDLASIKDSYKRNGIYKIIEENKTKSSDNDIYIKNIDMSNKIKNTVKKNLNTLLETKGFEDMEVAFGVKEKSDNLSAAEKKQFGSMETVQDKESGVINLGDASVQPELNKVHKEDLKDAEEYYKMVLDRMRNFQKTSESEPSQIGESIESPKVNREDDQTEPEEVYSTEALGPGMLALKYDNEGTPVHKKFEERMDDMNGDDLTYKKLKSYSEKYLKHKYEKPEEYHKTPKVRVTSESKVDENYSDVIKENIFKVKGEIKSKEQVLKLVDKLPNRVKIDESEFAITDGENYYKLIWEGSTEDGEAVIIREKNTKLVNESIDKMKDLWSFNSSDKTTTKKNIKEGNEDVFFKMMNKVRGK